MSKLNVAIVDGSRVMVELLEDVLQREEDMSIVGSATYGEAAFQVIKKGQPDVVLLDLIMPKAEGFSSLEQVKTDSSTLKQPIYIVMSLAGQERVTEGVKDYNPKSPDPISDCILGHRDYEPAAYVTNILTDMEAPVHLKGYRCLRDSIISCVNNVELLTSVTKLLYPAVSKMNRTTDSSVERAIRTIIDTIWKSGNQEMVKKWVGYNSLTKEKRPTNSEFIAKITDKVRLHFQYD